MEPRRKTRSGDSCTRLRGTPPQRVPCADTETTGLHAGGDGMLQTAMVSGEGRVLARAVGARAAASANA